MRWISLDKRGIILPVELFNVELSKYRHERLLCLLFFTSHQNYQLENAVVDFLVEVLLFLDIFWNYTLNESYQVFLHIMEDWFSVLFLFYCRFFAFYCRIFAHRLFWTVMICRKVALLLHFIATTILILKWMIRLTMEVIVVCYRTEKLNLNKLHRCSIIDSLFLV